MTRASTGKTRWIPVPCGEHGVEHGLTAGAAIVAVKAGQDGELVTVKGTPICFLDAVQERKHKSNGKLGDRTIDSIWSVE